MRSLFGFLTGLVFGLGFNVAGAWDPSLAFVMAGAAAVTFIGYRLVWRQPVPVIGDNFEVPSSTAIDRPLDTSIYLARLLAS
jgi:uncharacterized protein